MAQNGLKWPQHMILVANDQIPSSTVDHTGHLNILTRFMFQPNIQDYDATSIIKTVTKSD